MIRRVVVSALLVGVTLLSHAGASVPTNHEVLLLEPREFPNRWLEAEHRVAAELETAGFSVIRRQLEAVDQETLMRGLVNSKPAFASFVMLREGSGGAALVWLSGSARIKHFAMSDVSSSAAAGAIALRVTEYLNMQVLTITVPPPVMSPKPLPAKQPARTAVSVADPERASLSMAQAAGLLWLGLSATFSSDSDSVVPGASLGLAAALGNGFWLEVNADLVPLPLLVQTRAGKTNVSATSVRLHAQFEASLSERWSIGAGVGSGFLRVTSESEATPEFRGQTAAAGTVLLGARARLRYRANDSFSVLASIDPAISLPPISVRSDEQEVARLGRPWFSTTLGAGWTF
jgi:hypothetical protein